jgi:hypothetical protein
MVRNTWRLPGKSDSHAQRSRPEPLAIEMSATNPVAAVAVTCVISCAMGDACEMTKIPAQVLRKSMHQSAYHCQFGRASLSPSPLLLLCLGATSFSPLRFAPAPSAASSTNTRCRNGGLRLPHQPVAASAERIVEAGPAMKSSSDMDSY